MFRRLRRFVYAGTILLAIAPVHSTNAQAFDGDQLAQGQQSFQFVFNGRPAGIAVQTVTKEGTAYRLVLEETMPDRHTHRELTFDAKTLMPISHQATEDVQGAPFVGRWNVDSGRATGSLEILGPRGAITKKINAKLPVGSIDGEALWAAIAALPLAPGFKTTFSGLFAETGTVETYTVNVSGKETVKVPAGTFEAYKLVAKGSIGTATIWVSTEAPRRMVLFRNTGGFEIQLVK